MANFDWEEDYNWLMNQVSKIKDLELPCYGRNEPNGVACGIYCGEDSLCDACKVEEILRGI
jgi:hypothetical protein